MVNSCALGHLHLLLLLAFIGAFMGFRAWSASRSFDDVLGKTHTQASILKERVLIAICVLRSTWSIRSLPNIPYVVTGTFLFASNAV